MGGGRRAYVGLAALLLLTGGAAGLRVGLPRLHVRSGSVTLQSASASALPQQYAPSQKWLDHMATPVNPGFISTTVKGLALNPWGILYAAVTFFYAICILPPMMLMSGYAKLTGKHLKQLDWVVHLWAKMSLGTGLCFPRLLGAENLPPPGETVVYVPNHTSFVDILVMSGFVPRPFKYLSKSEIMAIPVIGYAMRLARHVFLKRDDLRSTVDCADQVVSRLIEGSSMVLFPEGTRSRDGRLGKFKKGAFQMAKQAGVRVVPISIGNLHRWMPPSALLPLAPIRGVYVMVHPAIETAGRPVKDVRREAEDAVNSGLPLFQQRSAEAEAAAPAGASE